MPQITEYTIITDFAPVALIKLVNEKIQEGWQPIGGVMTIVGPPQQTGGYVAQQTTSSQAMVRMA